MYRPSSFFPPTTVSATRRWLVVLVSLMLGVTARAHDPFTSMTHARVGGERIELEVALARTSALLLLPNGTRLPAITEENFEGFREPLVTAAAALFEVSAAGVPLPPRVDGVRMTGEENDIEFRVSYPRPGAGPVRFTGLYLESLIDDHVGTLVVKDDAGRDLGWEAISLQTPSLQLPLPPLAIADAAAGPPAAVYAPSFGVFLRLGIEHILRGYDHLLFLAGLLLACRRVRTMVVIITCFTLAHSITLALAVLEVVAIPGAVVEPLIAASIVFVGVENLVRRKEVEPRGRGVLTFCFGLIHGFGFAGALQEIGIGGNGSSLVVPLFSFNLGVELGQLAVAAVCLPLLLRLRRNPRFAYVPPLASVLVIAAGTYWLIERTLSV